MIYDSVGVPENGFVDTQPAPVDVPQANWSAHPILSRGELSASGDSFIWPHATPEQLAQLRDITVVDDGGHKFARLSAQFNFDRFVDSTFNEQQAVPPIGRIDDVQRFYTRVTGNGFHVVGAFTAITIAGRRRYFQWLTSTWVEIGQSGFLYVRDDADTHFSEVDEAQLEQYQPGATTTPVPAPSETWSMEHFEAHFGNLAAEPAPAAATQQADSSFDEDANLQLIAAMTTIDPDPEPTHMSIFAPRINAAAAQAPTADSLSESAPPPEPITVTEIGGPVSDAPAHRAPDADLEAEIESDATSSAAAEQLAPMVPAQPEPVAAPIAESTEKVAAPMNSAPGTPAPGLSEADAKAQQGIASALATIAHRGQVDRIGAAYIDHPARVAERFDWRNEPIQHAAAWLHSVMEDSDISERDLLEAGIRREVVEVVSVLTRRDGVSDADFYSAINANPIARSVKLADIADNGAPWRTRRLDAETQAEFAANYAAARDALGAAPGE